MVNTMGKQHDHEFITGLAN